MKGKKGWFKEPVRHGLAAKGIKTAGIDYKAKRPWGHIGHTVIPKAREIMQKYETGGYSGGAIKFEGLTPWQARDLIRIGALRPEERQNDSPTAISMVEIAEEYGLTLHGYRIVPEREDERITIEGVKGYVAPGFSVDEAYDKLVRVAHVPPDETEIRGNYIRVWWD